MTSNQCIPDHTAGCAPERLAVVISTYNNPEYLRLALEGYRQQHCHDFSIYIADDGSGADTQQCIEYIRQDFPTPIEYIWHEDRGFRKARVHNLALARIQEPYILLTDGDCIPLPHLVETHLRFASTGSFISGSRVLLSENWSKRLFLHGELDTDMPAMQWLWHRLKSDINRLAPLLSPVSLSAPNTRLGGIRGCHLSCYRDDLIRINGFDESYEGWGREDSDLVARLFHAGLTRRNLHGMPVLHLWHDEYSRKRLDANDDLLQACIHERRIEARTGLKQLEVPEHE
ncbi:MAG: glycosyltransferase family 2 protein [Mariprofundaceae bacterium]